MKRNKSVVNHLSVSCFILFFIIFSVGTSTSASEVKLPEVMQWTTYPTGSSGYPQASAIAHALLQEYGTKVRLLPSGTAVGRLLPVKLGRAHVGFLAGETFFATEGIYEFATPDLGPQDVRTILAAPTSTSLITTKKSGVKTLYDLKGKRVAWVVGNPSHYSKVTAFLAFADLTWDDVIRVDVPSHAAAQEALLTGQVDALVTVPSAGACYKLESSPVGIHYLPVPADDKAGWERLNKVLDFLAPYEETVGAGISKEQPAYLAKYRYPIIVVYNDTDSDFVYNFVKAMHETYGLYEKATPVMDRWNINQAGTTPSEAPFHEGAIRYLKEQNIWTAEDQSWNDNRLLRMRTIQEAWKTFLPDAKDKNLTGEQFENAWMKKREEIQM